MHALMTDAVTNERQLVGAHDDVEIRVTDQQAARAAAAPAAEPAAASDMETAPEDVPDAVDVSKAEPDADASDVPADA